MDADEGMYCAAKGSISLVVSTDCVRDACLAASLGVRGSSQLACVVGRDELLFIAGRARGDGGSIRPVCSGSTGLGGLLGGRKLPDFFALSPSELARLVSCFLALLLPLLSLGSL